MSDKNNIISVYISHNYKNHIDYFIIADQLSCDENFCVVSDIRQPNKAIDEQIFDCDICLILAGMYLTYGYDSILRQQIAIAEKMNKKIIIVKPWGTVYCPISLQEMGYPVINYTLEGVGNYIKGNI